MSGYLLKISGAGNRFLLADKKWFDGAEPPPEGEAFKTEKSFEDFLNLSKSSLSQRKAFIKALLSDGELALSDGLLVLRPPLKADKLKETKKAKEAVDLACDFYNKDGSFAEMCGNAACCLAVYAKDRGLLVKTFRLGQETVKTAQSDQGEWGIALNYRPSAKRDFLHKFQRQNYSFTLISPGVPHAVIEWPKTQNAPSALSQNLKNLKTKSGVLISQSLFLSQARKKLYSSDFFLNKALAWLKNKLIKLDKKGQARHKKRTVQIFLQSLSQNPHQLKKIAQSLRFKNPESPKGMNVSFFQVEKPGHLKAITYERGVEDWTLSCGTGALAVAFVYLYKYKAQFIKHVFINMPGGQLKIQMESEPVLFSPVKKGY